MKKTQKRRRRRILLLALCLVPPLTPISFADEASAQNAAHCVVYERAAPAKPAYVSATVKGIAAPEEVQRETHIAELKTGGSVSPDYVALPRILAVFMVNGVPHGTIAAVVDGHIPQAGETVELATRHRDPKLPCSFIPWTVVPAPTSL
jgi:hypothetical protein